MWSLPVLRISIVWLMSTLRKVWLVLSDRSPEVSTNGPRFAQTTRSAQTGGRSYCEESLDLEKRVLPGGRTATNYYLRERVGRGRRNLKTSSGSLDVPSREPAPSLCSSGPLAIARAGPIVVLVRPPPPPLLEVVHTPGGNTEMIECYNCVS